MAILGVSTDYTGRKKDISLLQYPDPTLTPASVTSISFSQALTAKQTVFPKFGKTTRFCAGTQKLIQKYAIMLLTALGSQPHYPEFGSSFIPDINAGIPSTSRLLAEQYFSFASYKVVGDLKTYQIDHPEIPEDERILSAELLALSTYADYVAFNVAITTEAEDSIVFLVPLPK
jgi:hypothetical protein